MNNGYVKVYRSLTEKGYYKDSSYVHLWVHLLMKATYQDKEYLFNNKIEYLKPGQCITGRFSLSRETGIQASKIERILKCFESEHQIEQQTTNKFRIITILNWSEYQQNEQQSEQQVNNQRTTSEQPVNTNNKEKKDKKENKEIYTSEFLQFYSAYPKHIGKEPAWKAWQKRNGDLPDIKTLLQKIENQKNTENWKKENGAFIPHPATWLNNARWEDEVIVKQKDLW